MDKILEDTECRYKSQMVENLEIEFCLELLTYLRRSKDKFKREFLSMRQNEQREYLAKFGAKSVEELFEAIDFL